MESRGGGLDSWRSLIRCRTGFQMDLVGEGRRVKEASQALSLGTEELVVPCSMLGSSGAGPV